MNINEMAAMTNVWGWVDHGGFEMYLGGNDCGISLRQIHGQEYETQSRELWCSLCGDGLMVDVGAHTGLYTLEAMSLGCRVISIEPYMLNYARLVMNIRKNGYSDSGVFYGAAGDKNGLASLGVNTTRSYCTSGGTIGEGREAFPVRMARLDSLIGEPVSAIKIDVEGGAAAVLRGASRILNDKPDILIECTEEGLTEILAPLGYKFFVVDELIGLEPCDDLGVIYAGSGLDMRRINRYCTVKP